MAPAWLAAHPGVKVISRDRGGGYGEAAAKAPPGSMQVADRWHLMENAGSAFLDAVRKSMRAIRGAIGATTITPALLTSAEKLQYESYLRLEETNAAIGALAREGVSIKQIVRRVGIAAISFARFCETRERRSSHPAKARSTRICCFATRNGRAAAGRAPNFGDVSKGKASVDPCA